MKTPLTLKVTWPRGLPAMTITHHGQKGTPRPAESYRGARRNHWFNRRPQGTSRVEED